MILFNKELLFVHNPKTAGTSLLHYLGRTLAGPINRAGVKEIGTHHPSLSLALGYACAITGNRVEDFRRIIGVVRNPYDREVSMYVFFRDVLCRSPTAGEDLNDADMERAVRMASRLAFRDYLEWLWEQFGTCDIWRSRCFYRTAEGRVPKNLRVLKIETLELDLANALAGLAMQNADPCIPRLNATQRNPTESYFDDRSTQLVAQSYRWMFEEELYEPPPQFDGRAAQAGVRRSPCAQP
jgi:hypothetical protein